MLAAGCASGGPPAGRTDTGGPSTPAASTVASPAKPSTSTGGNVPPATGLTSQITGWRLPGPLSRAQAVASGGRLLLLAGLVPGDRSSGQILAVDPAHGTVTPVGTLQVPVHDTAAAVLGPDVLLFAGGNSTEVSVVQTFPATDASPGPSGRSRTIGNLPQPRSDLEAADADGKIFLLGGYDGTRTRAEVLATTDGRSFTTAGTLPHPVRYGAAITIGNPGAQQVLLFGGQNGGVATDAIQRLDPATGTVSVVGWLPAPLSEAMAFALGGSVWIAGGTSGGKASDLILRYDPATGQAVPAGQLPYPVADAAVTVLDGTAYLLGGENIKDLDTVVTLVPRQPRQPR